MSSSSSPRGLGGAPRKKIIRGRPLRIGLSPLDVEIPLPSVPVDPARARVEQQRGYDDGFQAGLAEGRAAGQAAAAAESATVITHLEALGRSLVEAAEDLRRRQALELTGLEDVLARTALDLAAAVVGRELQLSAAPGADALARALALVPAGSAAMARLHPDDVASVGDRPGGLTVIPDPAIERGGCILEVGDSRIDAQLGSALDRVRAALFGEQR